MKRTILILVMFILLISNCNDNSTNPSLDGPDDIAFFISGLPKVGLEKRFASFQSMKDCENDLEEIARYLSISFADNELRSVLSELLKTKDVYWEISFNDFVRSNKSNNKMVSDVLTSNGLKDIKSLLQKHPDLRLSIPEMYEDSFNPLKEFIIAVSPVVDERYVTEIIAFDSQGNRMSLDPVKLSDMPMLVLEIDENPDNHPISVSESETSQLSQKQLKKTASTTKKIKLDAVYLYDKLEGTWNRAEFNVTVTFGTIWTQDHGKNYEFENFAERGFGITAVNWADKWYDSDVNHYLFDWDNPNDCFEPGGVLGICLWEDDPGGVSKLNYNSADDRYVHDLDFEHGFLDFNPDCPDDLYGYVFLEYWYINPNGGTHYAYGYNSAHGGNAAYQAVHEEYAKKNAAIRYEIYEE